MKKISLMAGIALMAACAWGENLTLKTGTAELAFAKETGALVSFRSLKTGWELNRRAELGLAWRLLVPLRDNLRDNPVLGSKQSAPKCETGADFIRFRWDGVISEKGGKLDISVVQEIRAEGDDAVWHTTIENRSPYIVESVYSPVVGDLTPPKDAPWLKKTSPNYVQAWDNDIWPTLSPNQGDYGMEYPTLTVGGSGANESFILLRSPNEGLYAGMKSAEAATVAWFFEALPGWDDAMRMRLPKADTISGKAVHTIFSVVHQPYIQPGRTEAITPIALVPYQGDWHAGADVYAKWMRTWSHSAVPPDWAREPHSWLQLHVNSPEDECRMRFTELPKVAEECRKYGVKAIQLVGWNDGGQDQGNPLHSPDPRLGTYEELQQAVAECEKIGVKVIIFSKFTWADRAEPWYREKLVDYAVKDPYGDPCFHQGYSYFTPAQFLGINTKRFSPMCFGSEEYLDLCENEFRKVAGLGAPGFLYDECQHHGPALCCHDLRHGHKYGWPVYANDLKLVHKFRTETPGLRKDFLFAGEACYDREFEEYMLAYFRSRFTWHYPMQRYIRPEVQIMTAVSGFNDRNMIDQCLMYRYIISYEPYSFHGWLHDFPLTVAYGQKMDALRTELRKWLWDGTCRDTVGAKVANAEGKPFDKYSRFVAADGSEMTVVSNYGDAPVKVRVTLDSGVPVRRYRAVEDAGWTALATDGLIPIAPMSAVVVQ